MLVFDETKERGTVKDHLELFFDWDSLNNIRIVRKVEIFCSAFCFGIMHDTGKGEILHDNLL